MPYTAYKEISKQLRFNILKITHEIGSGHPTTCLSAVDLAAVLFFKYLRSDLDNPANPANDRIIFSKGHASALLYSLYKVAGVITDDEFKKYRQFGSPLEGHPTHRFAFSEAATGSLGQGLSIAAGEAWGIIRKIKNQKSKIKNYQSETPIAVPQVYCLLGDGETAEGSVWEAVTWSAHEKLNNLITIVDVNRFGQSDETMLGHGMEEYRNRFESFGWGAIVIDGNDYGQIDAAFEKALVYKDGPVVILAKTIKGKGVSYWEDKNGFHNQMLPESELKKALKKFGSYDRKVKAIIRKPEREYQVSGLPAGQAGVKYQEVNKRVQHSIFNIHYSVYDKPIATKKALGNILVEIGKKVPNLVVLDGDVSNSLHTDQFEDKYPDRFLKMYIAEQNMAGVAVGLNKQEFIPFINTFAAFLTRAHDQLRMMPLSDVTVLVNGSYVGVSVGRDGPSQFGMEDIAMFRSIYGSIVLYPSDPYQTEQLVMKMFNQKGVVYIRTTREPTPIIYKSSDNFKIGSCFVHKETNKSKKDLITIISAGITLHEALKAKEKLEKENIAIRVIDLYSIKPIDKETLKQTARDSKAILVVEDHVPEGGLGEAVKSVLSEDRRTSIYHLAVEKISMSGSCQELLQDAGIDTGSIIKNVKLFV